MTLEVSGEKQTPSPAEHERQFTAALERLQDRINYRFQNEGLLVQALTSASHARLHEQTGASNAILEACGDRLLRKLINQWVKKHVRKEDDDLHRFFDYLLNSNVFYSVTGMRLGLDQFVRISQAHREGSDETGNMSLPERQQRMTSDALEALAAALYQDGGKQALQKFINEQLLSPHDEFVKDLLSLTSRKTVDIRATFRKLTKGRGKILIHREGNRHLASVAFDDAPTKIENGRPESLEADAARYAVLGFFKNHPWFLWRLDAPVSLVMPRTAAGANEAGLPLVNRALLEHRRNGSQMSGVVTFPPEELKRIEAWKVRSLPSLETASDRSHGRFIDQLRHELAARNMTLTVRAPAHNPKGKENYAFFANNQLLAIVWNASSLFDAAGKALSIFRATYAL